MGFIATRVTAMITDITLVIHSNYYLDMQWEQLLTSLMSSLLCILETLNSPMPAQTLAQRKQTPTGANIQDSPFKTVCKSKHQESSSCICPIGLPS